MEFGEFGGVFGERAAVHEESGRGGVRVVAQDLDHDVQQDALAVLAVAVEEGQDLGADIAGDGVAEQQVQEVDHFLAFGVVAEGVVQEAVPAWFPGLLGGDAGGAGVEVAGGSGLRSWPVFRSTTPAGVHRA